MGFDHLILKPAQEADLVTQVIDVLQTEFEQHQDKIYFFKLEPAGPKISQFSYFKTFETNETWFDFKWSFKYRPFALTFNFQKYRDHYNLTSLGVFRSLTVDIYRDRAKYWTNRETKHHVEDTPVISREIVEAGLKDLQNIFKLARRNRGSA